jgi:GNAT superfamily N-acetyltransferase
MEHENAEYLISTDPARLDLAFLCRALNATYWAGDRPRGVIEASVRNSICFGLYRKTTGEQVGFARVVTDQATFSWVCDVVIDESHRGQGLGKWLMSCVVAHPCVKNTNSLLGTRDAHGLYEKFGYRRSSGMRRPSDSPRGRETGTAGSAPGA